jgi:hypothetical protein
MIVETGYPWTREAAVETAGNTLTQSLRGYTVTPDGQAAFVQDLIQASMDNGGSGIFYWEPAWVPSEATTLWGQGSHWENATFFDFRNGNEPLPGLGVPHRTFTTTAHRVDGLLEEEYGAPLATDESGDTVGGPTRLDLVAMHGYLEPDYVNVALVIDGQLSQSVRGIYTVLLDTDTTSGAAIIDERRPIRLSGNELPDVRLDFIIDDYRGQTYGRIEYMVWDGLQWAEARGLCSYARSVGDNGTSVIELKINRSLLPGSGPIAIDALTMARGLAQAAVDVFGGAINPDEMTELTGFYSF